MMKGKDGKKMPPKRASKADGKAIVAAMRKRRMAKKERPSDAEEEIDY
jgi:hypothetical protein